MPHLNHTTNTDLLLDADPSTILTKKKLLETFNSQPILNTVWSPAKVGHASLDLFCVVASQIIIRRKEKLLL